MITPIHHKVTIPESDIMGSWYSTERPAPKSKGILDVEEAELRLQSMDPPVPRDQWIYIIANSEYNEQTKLEDRLGGFSCDRTWLEKDCVKWPNLFHTVVDGGNVDNVMFHVGGTQFFDRDTQACIEGNKLRKWIEKTVKEHREQTCKCFNKV